MYRVEPPAITVREASVNEALGVEARIPEFGGAYPAQTYALKLAGRPHLILVAEVGGEAVGYKVGFALDDTTFYSWLGGVVPGHRRRGVAGALRLHQERWASERGFTAIQVKSMNRFPDMLRALIGAGYAIKAVEGAAPDEKIVFQLEIG